MILDTLSNYYDWIKAIHVISVISWMAGMLYLPRLFVYHAGAKKGGELDQTLRVMEHKLLRFIMNPAMIITYICGLINAYSYGLGALGLWFHVKMGAVLALTALHGMMASWRKQFEKGENKKPHSFYRVMNEVVTLFMVMAVICVIVKPFE